METAGQSGVAEARGCSPLLRSAHPRLGLVGPAVAAHFEAGRLAARRVAHGRATVLAEVEMDRLGRRRSGDDAPQGGHGGFHRSLPGIRSVSSNAAAGSKYDRSRGNPHKRYVAFRHRYCIQSDTFRFMREDTMAKILDATRALLVEGGVRRLTVEGVAARSGVAKTTIYRRYRSKDELALAVLLRMVEEVVTVPDVGDIRAELIAFVGGAVRILGTTVMGSVMQGLVSDLASDPELGEAFRDQIVSTRLAEVRRLLERGAIRGQLRAGLDAELAHDLLFGPVYYRLLLSGRPLDEALAERIVDAVLPAMLSSGTPLGR
jgi:AcrR family transcriptional regulator